MNRQPWYLPLVFMLLAGLLAAASPVAGMDPNEPVPANKPLFDNHEVLDISLTADFDAMCRPNEVENCQYSPTTLLYTTAAGVKHEIPVEIRVRGGWRARKSHCTVPPLFVRFSAAAVAATPFAGQGLLPLTTHCRSRKARGFDTASSRDYEQYVLKEYLGYRFYNIVTDRSLRVRLARITYRNPARTGKSISRYAFFTEHFDEMAARQGAHRLPLKSFDHEKIDLPTLDQISLFNFMIGNTDSSVVRQRNVVLIAGADGRQYPVPFDLDMSGLVDAEYGGVSPRLDFRDPRQRYYLGFCHPHTDFDTLFARYQNKQSEILALLEDTPGLSRSARKESRAYLKKFFAILAVPERRREAIAEACHPWPPAPQDHTTPPDTV